MKKSKTLFVLILSLLMIFSLTSYVYADGEENVKTLVRYETSEEIVATAITADTEVLDETNTDGWYYVDSEIKVDHTITVEGNIGIILSDDAVLEFTTGEYAGLCVGEGSSLTVCGEEEYTGVIYNSSNDANLILLQGGNFYLTSGAVYSGETCIYAEGDSYIGLEGGVVMNDACDDYAIIVKDSSDGELQDGAMIVAKGNGIDVQSHFTMSGGIISGEDEGYIGVNNERSFIMTGGEIKKFDKGIESDHILELGGSAKVINNDINVELDGIPGLIEVVESPSEEFQVGLKDITLRPNSKGNPVIIIVDADESYLDYFTSDVDYQTLYMEDGNLMMGLTGKSYTGSVFSSSTGLLILGAIVIVIAAIIVILIKKKPATK